MPAEDGDRRDDEADRSTLDRPTLLSVAGGDGGLQDVGGAFNPAILFSEINFLIPFSSGKNSPTWFSTDISWQVSILFM